MTVLLITNTFPFGPGESFIEAEIPYLEASFDKVVILPLKGRKGMAEEPKRPLSEKVQVILPRESIIDRTFPRFRDIPAFTAMLLRVLAAECSTLKTALHVLKPKHFVLTCLRANRAVLYEREYKRLISEHGIGEHIVYSYWVDAWLAGILNHTRKQHYPVNVISRAHRGDLYNESSSFGYQTCRKFIFKHITQVYPISYNGKAYLLERYPELERKISVFHLGVTRQDSIPELPENAVFTSLSCSFVSPVKRVDLILAALDKLPADVPAQHYHIGNGPLLEAMQQQQQSQESAGNSKITWTGYKTQEELLDFYRSNRIDVFINVSKSEGVPVSIMEAISFGIPVIATDVGGTSDVVRPEFGYLLPENFAVEELVAHLLDLQSKTPEEHRRMSRAAFDFATAHFDADANFRAFCAELRRVAGADRGNRQPALDLI